MTSVTGDIPEDIRYLDSRGLAREILGGLQDVLRPGYSTAGGPAVNESDLPSKLRQIIDTYFKTLQKAGEEETHSSKSPQNPIYRKVHGMACSELEFLVEQVTFLCRDGSSNAMGLPSVEDVTIPDIDPVETVPAVLAIDFLIGVKAFGLLRLRLRRLMEEETMDIIRTEVMLNLPLTSLGLYTGVFNAHWELPTFAANKLDEQSDIGHVLTLTGGISHAYAARCADYLKWLWKDSGFELYNHVEEYLKDNIYEHFDSTLLISPLPDGRSGIRATVIGAKETIIDVAQQLAWLTAALRSSTMGAALSDVDFIAIKGMEFFIEPSPLTKVPSSLSGEDSCWHRLVRNVAIASGFPIPPRRGQVGLELPFAAMLTLSRTKTFVMANKRLVLYGFSSFLFPTDFYPDKAHDQTECDQSI
ncbi:hypothetical protein BJX65DRAFT_225210 [Aspergillus insuetus]